MNTQAHNNNYDNVSEKLWTVFGLCAYFHAAYVLAVGFARISGCESLHLNVYFLEF